ncbi:TetR/AcrR family transcriptional regulator [Bacteroidota bacterium]
MPRTKEQLEKIKGKTRSNILHSALELFSHKGFHGTSMNDIAVKAGISKGLAYNYFKSKNDILRAILDEAILAGKEIQEKSFKSDDPYLQIKSMIEMTFKHIEEHETYWRMFASLMLQPELTSQSAAMVDEFGTNVAEKLSKVFQNLGIKNPNTESKLFDASLDGIILHYLYYKKQYPLAKVKKQLLKRYSKEYLDKI